MRDPNRIQLVLDKVKEVWSKRPDLRLGQLIDNCANELYSETTFFIEDDKLMQALDVFDKSE